MIKQVDIIDFDILRIDAGDQRDGAMVLELLRGCSGKSWVKILSTFLFKEKFWPIFYSVGCRVE